MGIFSIAVHGGAGPDAAHIQQNLGGYAKGIADAVKCGYQVLEKRGTAVDAVEAAVRCLEDNPLFNAGRGSVLNDQGEVETEASIMNGIDRSFGAAALLHEVKNPVSLARHLMDTTGGMYLAGPGAVAVARSAGLDMRPPAYFITEYNYDEFERQLVSTGVSDGSRGLPRKPDHGTVGAVACDANGNLAAATSTGGLENKRVGRIADSSMVGVGSFAHNPTCAASCTGDGEVLIKYGCASSVSALIEYKDLKLQEACGYLIKEKCRDAGGDIGVIAVDTEGAVGAAYNSERMHRGWKSSASEMEVYIYEKRM